MQAVLSLFLCKLARVDSYVTTLRTGPFSFSLVVTVERVTQIQAHGTCTMVATELGQLALSSCRCCNLGSIIDAVGKKNTVADPFQYDPNISPGGRAAADEAGSTPYGRPEDTAISVDNNGDEVFYVPTTTEDRAYTIVLLDATNAFVKIFCDRNAIDISTG
jgi:secreted PhoX family phosphatase